MEIAYISEEEKNCCDILAKLDQKHILALIPQRSKEERQAFVEQVQKLNRCYPGGLEAYYNRARKLLEDSLEGVNPYEGFKPSPPPTENIDYASESFMDFEDTGAEELCNSAFVLVAGGLGERLGYDGIKVQIPIDLISETSFLEYYVKYILAFQKKHGKGKKLPLAIMTSDDTHALTVKLLQEHKNFGMENAKLSL